MPNAERSGDLARPARPLRRDAQRNREAILAAARQVFCDHGLEAPLEEIARRAGVGIGTLYRRFPSRVQLLYLSDPVAITTVPALILLGMRLGTKPAAKPAKPRRAPQRA